MTPCSHVKSHIRLAMVPLQFVINTTQIAMAQNLPDTTKIQLAKTYCSPVMNYIRIAMVSLQLVMTKIQPAIFRNNPTMSRSRLPTSNLRLRFFQPIFASLKIAGL